MKYIILFLELEVWYPLYLSIRIGNFNIVIPVSIVYNELFLEKNKKSAYFLLLFEIYENNCKINNGFY